MKKDYEPILEGSANRDETEHIRSSWTDRWSAFSALPNAASIAKREEYRLMAPYLAQLPRGARMFDGGCGLGEWTVYLTQLGYDVVGFDLSAPTIARLKAQLPDHRFEVGDIRATSFADASFDAYFSWGTFEHFELGMEACVREAYRILKPGGLLFASVPFQNLRHVFRDLGPLHTWDEHYERKAGYGRELRFYQWRFTSPEFRRELELRGFRVQDLRPIGRRHGVNRFLQHEGRWLARIPFGAAAARRILTPILPSVLVAHMLWAAAEKRPPR
ncbi:MAG: methyltransferase domain-containing protein [Elusimicrobia bacterium]|nr:methyltransferase domain-containing protein [Elusimicrobiota bacterium]